MNDSTAKTRWTQFTLRAALVLFLVVAAFLAGQVSSRSKLRESQANEEAAQLRMRDLVADLVNAELRAEVAKLRANDAEHRAVSLQKTVTKLRRASLDRNELLNARTYQELRDAYWRNGMFPPRTGIPIIHKELIQKAPEPDER